MQEDDQGLILQIFQAFDSDLSGTLDIAEFRQLLQMLYGKANVPLHDVDDFCAMLQIEDGKLEYSTFVKACQLFTIHPVLAAVDTNIDASCVGMVQNMLQTMSAK
jgi:hypothetical protein